MKKSGGRKNKIEKEELKPQQGISILHLGGSGLRWRAGYSTKRGAAGHRRKGSHGALGHEPVGPSAVECGAEEGQGGGRALGEVPSS